MEHSGRCAHGERPGNEARAKQLGVPLHSFIP